MTLLGGRYELFEEIGRGGTAVVHRARDHQTDSRVAVKLLKGAAQRTRQAVGRFIREAHLMSQLNHPNSTRILDFGESDRGLFLVMEFLEGDTLEARMNLANKLPPRAAAGVAACVAAALSEVHSLGIVHRDIKPANVFLAAGPRGTVIKLMDFGVSKLVAPSRTRRGGLYATTVVGGDKLPAIGTVQYLAPEQVSGASSDTRSDLYALGALLHAMLAGEPPFGGSNQFMIMKGHVKDPPPPIEGAPEALQSLVYSLLQKKPEDRIQTAAEVNSKLRRWLLLNS